MMHPNQHGPLHDMVDTYGQHGADNLSLWLTNAKEAAAKITEATRARQKEKEEKYGKFLRDLHCRVAVSSKEKRVSKIPQARPRRLPLGQIDSNRTLRRSKCEGLDVHKKGRDLGPIFKEVPDLVNSEPCTPTGWKFIPTSFSALEMRSLEGATSPTPLDMTEAGDLKVSLPQVVSAKGNLKRLHVESCGLRVLGRSQSSLSRFSRVGHTQRRGKENIRLKTSLGNWSVNDNTRTCTRELRSHSVSRDSKRKQSPFDASVSGSSLSSQGVTTCPMGVVVMKGREEYEIRGQGKQFLSDVWKCAMEVERRCANERAHFLHILKKKRLEQQKAEKRHKAELLREKSIAKQREAVQMQLKSVAALKARREGIVQSHRAVEKKRFSHALQAMRLEKMQGYGVQVPQLCNCGHGVNPLNVNYIKKCRVDCPLRNNFSEYALQLENKLQQLLDYFNATSYSTNGLHWPSTNELYDCYGSWC